MTSVTHLDSAPPQPLAPGVAMRSLFGERAMLNLVDLEAHSGVTIHSHPHEQLGYVLEGTLHLTVDGVEHVLDAGSAFCIPGGVEHAARADERACRVLDVFSPPREEYRG
jgi:quercetin dioxygenase-like cupin family protein